MSCNVCTANKMEHDYNVMVMADSSGMAIRKLKEDCIALTKSVAICGCSGPKGVYDRKKLCWVKKKAE